MAHDFIAVAAGLSVHSAWRQPAWKAQHVPQSHADNAARGAWHGASWNFVFWGLLHGLALAVNHWWTRERKQPVREFSERSVLSTVAGWAATYAFVCITWVFFRSTDFSTSMIILKKLFLLDTSGVTWFYSPFFMLLPIVIAGHAMGVLAQRRKQATESRDRRIFRLPGRWPLPVESRTLRAKAK